MSVGVGPPKTKIWVKRSVQWVPTVTTGPGHIKYLTLANLGDKEVILHMGIQMGWWMVDNMIPRSQAYVSVEFRHYNEWQTLALEATTDQEEGPKIILDRW